MPAKPDFGAGLKSALEAARRDLLDLGLRNPLLNYRLLRARGLEVTWEDPSEVFRLLVRDEKRMTFLPASVQPPVVNGNLLEQPEEAANRVTDLRLRTPYASAELQKRLLATYHAAHTSIEEQGVNTLYLALGMIRWMERDDTQKTHQAPLILVPVELERSDARDRFHLKYSGEEIGDNVSLAEKLKVEFGYKSFPELPDPEDLDVGRYFQQVARLVRREDKWGVDKDAIALGFFSFAKLLMYRDLDPSTWPDAKGLLGHDVLLRLLGESGFERDGSKYSNAQPLDDQVRDRPPMHVVDADSTQTLAILDAFDGHNMIIQGPPGTGKSQTIVNLISAAVSEGKRVLFVSEKMAALDVVKRRLDAVGVGGPCLELHSNRTNKKTILDQLKLTVFHCRNSAGSKAGVERLAELRDRLNAYCKAVNEPIGNSGETPCSAFGRMLETSRALRGVELPAFKIDAAAWSAAETATNRELVEKLQQRVARCGVPVKHPFWGCGLLVLLPTDSDDIARSTKAVLQKLGELIAVSESLATLCNVAPPASIGEAEAMAETAGYAATAPELGALDPANTNWMSREAEVTRIVQAGRSNHDLRRSYSGMLLPEAWGRNVSDLRRDVDEVGSRIWRFLSPAWRRLKRDVASLCVSRAPRDRAGMLGLLDVIIEASTSMHEVEECDRSLSTLFGPHWRALASDWDLLESQMAWIREAQRRVSAGSLARWCLTLDFRALDRRRLTQVASSAKRVAAEFDASVVEWARLLKMDRPLGLRDQPWSELRDRWGNQLARLDQLPGIAAFNQIAVECRKRGWAALLEIASDWEHAASHLVSLFERYRLSAVLQRAFMERPTLAAFNGTDHTNTVEDFRRLDLLGLEHNRALIAARHWQSMPAGGGSGELGVLWREFEKKRRHLPIRKLMESAGHAIQSIKPVFMMSPLSIANYLPPACLEFDIVIFDEASQVKPVDGLGAIVRGKQILVVGDSKQLPPTSFFDFLASADESDGDDGAATSDIESILGMFSARGAHQRMLQWHYRSRHESLISVSNHLFYDDRLVVFPSPTRERKSLGLVYRRLDNSWYDRSRTRTNPEEAKAVASAVMGHAREQLKMPGDQCHTLGVAAFSVAQMDAILEQVELLRRQDPSCEEFFGYPPHEPFFVKNLENVQGDERDVIFISIGYGRTLEGFLAMNFGPLNRPGGERRLNVLISRARRRCEVFTSLTADDIDTTRTPSAGVAALKTFLHYAQTGLIETSAPTGRPADSDFEEQVRRELSAHGYTVHAQVGCAGFFIDLAVVDPDQPGRYLLGIECDGASYHSARSARDRDRLRQNVLDGLGWCIYRIWPTDSQLRG